MNQRYGPLYAILLLLLAMIRTPALANDGGDSRKPIPSAADQAAASKLIKELYHDQFVKLQPAERGPLAAKLLEQATATKDDDSSKYVLLIQARDTAAAAGDLEIAFSAVDQFADTFAVDRLEVKAAALPLISSTVKAQKSQPRSRKLVWSYAMRRLLKTSWSSLKKLRLRRRNRQSLLGMQIFWRGRANKARQFERRMRRKICSRPLPGSFRPILKILKPILLRVGICVSRDMIGPQDCKG